MVLRRFNEPNSRSQLGQALVETALLLPILLILLLGAVDFGRLFFGWVNIHQAARIGANYGSTHPNMTASERDELVLLVEGDTAALNCEIDDPVPNPTYTTAAGTPTSDPSIGDFSNFTIGCEFSMVTPLAGLFFGDTIPLSANATFPVRGGCVNCPTPAPATPPPTPLQCREVPAMAGMSIAGARLAWASAGFLPANFTPLTGQDHQTVAPGPVITQTPLSTCTSPFAVFDSSVVVVAVPFDLARSILQHRAKPDRDLTRRREDDLDRCRIHRERQPHSRRRWRSGWHRQRPRRYCAGHHAHIHCGGQLWGSRVDHRRRN